MGLRGVLWDMDGTLVDTEKVWTISLADTARMLGGELSAAAREAMVGSSMQRTLTLMWADLGLAHDPARTEEAAAYLTERTGELFAEDLVWRPGAQEALRTVRAAGLRSALVTNTGRSLTERVLDVIGRENFDATVCSDEVTRGKPAPDPYRRGAALLGLDPRWCLAVEDSPTGAASAQAAGASVLVVPCDVDVPLGPGWVLRPSLAGMTVAELETAWAQAGRVSA